jgi:hypothetical protein
MLQISVSLFFVRRFMYYSCTKSCRCLCAFFVRRFICRLELLDAKFAVAILLYIGIKLRFKSGLSASRITSP